MVEDPFGPQPQGKTLDGIAGGTMGANHPISFCKDYQGGRSFYTGARQHRRGLRRDDDHAPQGRDHLGRGHERPGLQRLRRDGAARTTSRRRSARRRTCRSRSASTSSRTAAILQTDRLGSLRLHDPATGTTTVIANFADPALPLTQRIYTNQEDGLYGPAVDANFATNKWVYLYYSPQTVTDVKLLRRRDRHADDADHEPAERRGVARPRGIRTSATSSSRASSSSRTPPARTSTSSSEQQILRVSNNRQECCHVAGDIDFDKHGNLWMATGDDTPAGGINGGGFGLFNAQKTDEQQTVRVTNATAGTFTLTFDGQTTAPLAYNATAAQVDAALEALSNVGADNIQTSGGPVNTANVNVFFRRALQQSDQPQITANGAGPDRHHADASPRRRRRRAAGISGRPATPRRTALNTNDLRGKVLRIKVKDTDITAADANKADLGTGTGAYTIPSGNLFPLVARRAAGQDAA